MYYLQAWWIMADSLHFQRLIANVSRFQRLCFMFFQITRFTEILLEKDEETKKYKYKNFRVNKGLLISAWIKASTVGKISDSHQKVPGSILGLVEGWALGNLLSSYSPWTGTIRRWFRLLEKSCLYSDLSFWSCGPRSLYGMYSGSHRRRPMLSVRSRDLRRLCTLNRRLA